MKERVPDVAKITSVFFNAMKKGYAGNAVAVSIPQLPGAKAIFHEEPEFTVIDCYTVGLENWAFGTTVIRHNNIPVWVMQYHGQYPKEVIPFLKRALTSAYSTKEFLGGRGPSLYSEYGDSALAYSNHFEGDFRKFKGTEEIFPLENSKSPSKIGSHEYSGRLLF